MGSDDKKEKLEGKEGVDCRRFNMEGEENKMKSRRDSEKRDGGRKEGMG